MKYKTEANHSKRVAEISKKIAYYAGLSDKIVHEMEVLGLMHDIGKVAIKENLLDKPTKLTPDELSEITRHPEIGYRILSTSDDMAEIAEYVLTHHERYDGTGYPSGIRGEEIPLQARILAVADAFDVMTSNQPYRDAQTVEYSIQELQENAGTQFDPNVVKIFIEKVLPNLYHTIEV